MGDFLTTFEHLFDHFIDHFCARRNRKGAKEHDRAPRGGTSRIPRPNSRPPRHNSGAHAALSQVATYSSQRNSFQRLFLRIEMCSSTGQFRLMGGAAAWQAASKHTRRSHSASLMPRSRSKDGHALRTASEAKRHAARLPPAAK